MFIHEVHYLNYNVISNYLFTPRTRSWKHFIVKVGEFTIIVVHRHSYITGHITVTVYDQHLWVLGEVN